MKHDLPFKTEVKRAESKLQSKAINELIHKYVHDIRSSLTSIKPYADLLRKVEDSLTKNRILDQIGNSSQNIELLLIQLIEEIDELNQKK